MATAIVDSISALSTAQYRGGMSWTGLRRVRSVAYHRSVIEVSVESKRVKGVPLLAPRCLVLPAVCRTGSTKSSSMGFEHWLMSRLESAVSYLADGRN